MKYRKLGRTGVRVSEILYGSWLIVRNPGRARRGQDHHPARL